jgi:hypothetical protein
MMVAANLVAARPGIGLVAFTFLVVVRLWSPFGPTISHRFACEEW